MCAKKSDATKSIIEQGECYLGVEFGSTRIKAVLIDINGTVLGTGVSSWENHFVDGVWTYPLHEVWSGLQECYKDLAGNIYKKYETYITKIKCFGISAMMHGYLPFDKDGEQIADFRTWRNNITSEAADVLTKLFNYNIPQRWSIAHLYQAILNKEEHVSDIDYLTTLAGYVHWRLTGEKVVGVGEASGMFPVSLKTKTYDTKLLEKFDKLDEVHSFPWTLTDILPKVLVAGEQAGLLTEKGAELIDPSGKLKAGAIACPPEGDAGTGMVATNSLKVGTGNISCGTSAFAMVVLKKELKKLHIELDMVTTPNGDLVAMSHANNCTTEINVWFNLFKELLELSKSDMTDNEIFTLLFENSLEGDYDCDGIVPYGFHSGEDIVGLNKGCPMLIHPTESTMNLANFVRAQLYSCFAAMKLGIDILVNDENVEIEKIVGHGGVFTTPIVAQTYLGAAIGSTVDVISTASEGGAWGIALLSSYVDYKFQNNKSLNDYIDKVFEDIKIISITPSQDDIDGYKKFINNFKLGLNSEIKATEVF